MKTIPASSVAPGEPAPVTPQPWSYAHAAAGLLRALADEMEDVRAGSLEEREIRVRDLFHLIWNMDARVDGVASSEERARDWLDRYMGLTSEHVDAVIAEIYAKSADGSGYTGSVQQEIDDLGEVMLAAPAPRTNGQQWIDDHVRQQLANGDNSALKMALVFGYNRVPITSSQILESLEFLAPTDSKADEALKNSRAALAKRPR